VFTLILPTVKLAVLESKGNHNIPFHKGLPLKCRLGYILKKNLLHTLGTNLFMNSNHMSASTFKSHIKIILNCYCRLYIFRILDDLIFSISQDGQSPPSPLYNGYQDSFLGLGCGVDHSPPFSTKFKEERDLYLYTICNYMAC
jgi:hypothetical protein